MTIVHTMRCNSIRREMEGQAAVFKARHGALELEQLLWRVAHERSISRVPPAARAAVLEALAEALR